MRNLDSLRYNDVWSDWRPTDESDAGQEETLELRPGEDITSVSRYTYDATCFTYSLQAETSAGRQWGPFGDHHGYGDRSVCSSPPTSSGLRLHHLSGDQTLDNMILRWLQL